MDGFPPAPALVSVSAKRTAPVSGPVVSLFIYAMSKCHAAKFIIQHLRKGLRMGAGRTPLDTPGTAKGPTEASFANVRMFVESVILGHTHSLPKRNRWRFGCCSVGAAAAAAASAIRSGEINKIQIAQSRVHCAFASGGGSAAAAAAAMSHVVRRIVVRMLLISRL